MEDWNNCEMRIEQLEAKIHELEKAGSAEERINASAMFLMGTALAMVLSWSRNASILWCILHGVLSWLYVIYFAFTR